MSDESQLRALFERTQPPAPAASIADAVLDRLQRQPTVWAWRPLAAVSVALLVGIAVGLWSGKAPTVNASSSSSTLSSRLWSDASGGLASFQEEAR